MEVNVRASDGKVRLDMTAPEACSTELDVGCGPRPCGEHRVGSGRSRATCERQ